MAESIGPGLRRQWQLFSRLPGSKWLFSHALGSCVPYSGSIGARVEVLEPGHCVVTMRDRRRVRNHLDSVHAVALANLAELATGLALMNSLPDKARGILGGISIDYLKKARGRLTATCHCDIPPSNAEHEYILTGEIRNTDGEVVAAARARWLVGPEQDA
ncbi:MAG: hotdog fold domain-containing protein [Thiohalobacterales bacterium]|nr:hotdog fold domain-containing protein [Thiohalobacterales bacterium]